jgi:hypothetical protein
MRWDIVEASIHLGMPHFGMIVLEDHSRAKFGKRYTEGKTKGYLRI